MKNIKRLIVIACILTISNIQAQNQEEKNDERIGIFSMEEFSNLHIWVDNKIKEMRLSEDILEKYESSFEHNLGRIGRVPGKKNRDKILPKDEFLKSMEKNISKLNSEVASILSEDENKKHLELMAEFEKIITNKLELRDK